MMEIKKVGQLNRRKNKHLSGPVLPNEGQDGTTFWYNILGKWLVGDAITFSSWETLYSLEVATCLVFA
jgi:hypothetical protein